MAFCIMRMKKIKSRVSLTYAAEHNSRWRIPPNADPEKLDQNWMSMRGTPTQMVVETMSRYAERLPEKVRKNAVHAIEVVCTASPTFKGAWDSYLADADRWVKDLFGADSVLHIAHHMDETTPHTHILVMPLLDGRLNAKHYTGGVRTRMAELQTDFFEKVGKKHDLERGVSRAETKARHTPSSLAPLKEKYETFEHARRGVLGMWNPPPAKAFESAKAYRARLEPEVLGIVAMARQKAQEAVSAKKEATSAKRAADAEALALRDEKRKVRALVESLTGTYGDVRQAQDFIAMKKQEREVLEREALAKAKAKKRSAPSYDGYER
jgi:hypothetical protein